MKTLTEAIKTKCNGKTIKTKGKCPREKHDTESGKNGCKVYCFAVCELGEELQKLINEFLVFFEYDFETASHFPLENNDVLLISNPIAETRHHFAILAFEKELPKVEGKGYCAFCEELYTKNPGVEYEDGGTRTMPNTEHNKSEILPNCKKAKTCQDLLDYIEKLEKKKKSIPPQSTSMKEYDRCINDINENCLQNKCCEKDARECPLDLQYTY